MTPADQLKIIARRLQKLARIYSKDNSEALSVAIGAYGKLYKTSGLMLLDPPQWYTPKNNILWQQVEKYLPNLHYCFAHSTRHAITGNALLSRNQQAKINDGKNRVNKGFRQSTYYNTQDFVFGLLQPESLQDYNLLGRDKSIKTYVISILALLEQRADVASKPISPTYYQKNASMVLHHREILPGVFYKLMPVVHNNKRIIYFNFYSGSVLKYFSIIESHHYAHGYDILRRQIEMIVRFSELLLEVAPREAKDFLQPLLDKSGPKDKALDCLLKIISWLPVPELTVPGEIKFGELGLSPTILSNPQVSILEHIYRLVRLDDDASLVPYLNDFLGVTPGEDEAKSEEALVNSASLKIKLRSLSWKTEPKNISVNILQLAIFLNATKIFSYLMNEYAFLADQCSFLSPYRSVGGLYSGYMSSKYLAAIQGNVSFFNQLHEYDPRKHIINGQSADMVLNFLTVAPYYSSVIQKNHNLMYFKVNVIRLIANLVLETETLSVCQTQYFCNSKLNNGSLIFRLKISPNDHQRGVHQAQAPILWNLLNNGYASNQDSMRVALPSSTLKVDISAEQYGFNDVIQCLFAREVYTILLCAQNTDYWLANAKFHPITGQGATDSTNLLRQPTPLDRQFFISVSLMDDLSIKLIVDAGFEEIMLAMMHRAWRIPLNRMRIEKGSVHLLDSVSKLVALAHQYRCNYQGCLVIDDQGRLSLAERKVGKISLGYATSGGHNNDPYAMPPWKYGDMPLKSDDIYPSVGVIKGLEEEFGIVISPEFLTKFDRMGKKAHTEYWVYQGPYTLTKQAELFCESRDLPFMPEADEFDPLTARFYSLLELEFNAVRIRRVGLEGHLIKYFQDKCKEILSRHAISATISVIDSYSLGESLFRDIKFFNRYLVIAPVAAEEDAHLLNLLLKSNSCSICEVSTGAVQVKLCNVFKFIKKLSGCSDWLKTNDKISVELQTICENKLSDFENKIKTKHGLNTLSCRVVYYKENHFRLNDVFEVSGCIGDILSFFTRYLSLNVLKKGRVRLLEHGNASGLTFRVSDHPIFVFSYESTEVSYSKIFSEVIGQLLRSVENVDNSGSGCGGLYQSVRQDLMSATMWLAEKIMSDIDCRGCFDTLLYARFYESFSFLWARLGAVRLPPEFIFVCAASGLHLINFFIEVNDSLSFGAIAELLSEGIFLRCNDSLIKLLEHIIHAISLKQGGSVCSETRHYFFRIINSRYFFVLSQLYPFYAEKVFLLRKIVICIGESPTPEINDFLDQRIAACHMKKNTLVTSSLKFVSVDSCVLSFSPRFWSQYNPKTHILSDRFSAWVASFNHYTKMALAGSCAASIVNPFCDWFFKLSQIPYHPDSDTDFVQPSLRLKSAILQQNYSSIRALLLEGASIFYLPNESGSTFSCLSSASSRVVETVLNTLLFLAIDDKAVRSPVDFLGTDFYYLQFCLSKKVKWSDDFVYYTASSDHLKLPPLFYAIVTGNIAAIEFLSKKIDIARPVNGVSAEDCIVLVENTEVKAAVCNRLGLDLGAKPDDNLALRLDASMN